MSAIGRVTARIPVSWYDFSGVDSKLAQKVKKTTQLLIGCFMLNFSNIVNSNILINK